MWFNADVLTLKLSFNVDILTFFHVSIEHSPMSSLCILKQVVYGLLPILAIACSR
jgi:hypothetical protein